MSQDLPKISIVTPSFNQGRFLEATLLSVLSQGYPRLEYIVIDGGSTDGSAEIIRRYAGRLHYWCSEPDGGHYAAVNKGFAHASGEIYGWLNSDDLHFPWTLRTVASIFAQLPEVRWLSTLNPGHADHEGFIVGFGRIEGFSRDALLDGCYLEGGDRFMGYIQQESTFWRADLWRAAGGVRTDVGSAGDFDLWARFYEREELVGTRVPLAAFRSQQGQRSRDKAAYLGEATAAVWRLRQRLAEAGQSVERRRLRRRVGAGGDGAPAAVGRRYRGKQVARINADTPAAAWQIQEYTFR